MTTAHSKQQSFTIQAGGPVSRRPFGARTVAVGMGAARIPRGKPIPTSTFVLPGRGGIRRLHSGPQRPQRGAVLLVALIFLLLMTMLAIAASSGSLLQQRMVAATRNAQLATMSADTALRGAEWTIWGASSVLGGAFLCNADSINATTGCVKFDRDTSPYASDGDVTQFRSVGNGWLSLTGPITYKGAAKAGFTTATVASDTGSPNVAENPQYIIEDMGLVKPPGAGPQHESGVSGPMSGGAGKLSIHIYRITARATGGAASTVRVMQSTFDAQTN